MLDLMSYLNSEKVKAYALKNHTEVVQTWGCKEYYKISLLSGRGVIHYDSRCYEVNGSTLLLSKPGNPCTWKLAASKEPLFTTLFTADFLDGSCFHGVAESEFLQSQQAPVFGLEPKQTKFIASVFRKMMEEQNSLYRYKSELLQNHICLLLHAALRMQPAIPCLEPHAWAITSSAQLVAFVEMQFPPMATLVHYN
jgi:AraC family transcriptional activator of pobA